MLLLVVVNGFWLTVVSLAQPVIEDSLIFFCRVRLKLDRYISLPFGNLRYYGLLVFGIFSQNEFSFKLIRVFCKVEFDNHFVCRIVNNFLLFGYESCGAVICP